MPLVKWLLAVPALLGADRPGIGVLFANLIAFFAVLFTGRYPRGLFDFVLGRHRWGWRVTAYVFLMTDEYPPFSLDEDADYPATLRDRLPGARRPLAAARPLAAGDPVLLRRLDPVSVAGDRRLRRVLRDPVHEAAARRACSDLILIPGRWSVRAQAYFYFAGDGVPAVRMGRVTATRRAP